MDTKSTLPSADVDVKESVKYTEYESLLDLNEKQGFPMDKFDTSKEGVTDIEAGHPKFETDESQTPKPPRAPLTHEEALALRIKPMDNIRTVALSLILLQNAAIQAISTHRDAAHVHYTWPKSFILISLFVRVTRLLAVPLLFFIAGFSSQFTMVIHGRSPLQFSLRKTWKTALTVIFYQSFTYLAKLARPLPPANTATSTPYYASREGILAVLNGPTAYVLAILVLDCIYAIFRAINLFMSSPNKPTHFITTEKRYENLTLLFVPVVWWVIVCGSGLAHKILPMGSAAEHWLYAANTAELHFPFLYIFAYTAGVHFVHYYRFMLPTGRCKVSPMTILFSNLAIIFTWLCWMYYAFPSGMIPFLDVRQRPALDLQASAMGTLYSMWVVYTLMVIPDAMIGVFFTNRSLAMDWGNFSRTAHFQVYVQMLYVVGNPVRIFDNILLRWAMLGWMGMCCAYYGGVGTISLGNLAKCGWFAVRRRLGRKVEQPINI